MLSIFELIHAAPAFLMLYGGFTLIIGHKYALAAVLIIATFTLICTTVAPKMIDEENVKNLKERREA